MEPDAIHLQTNSNDNLIADNIISNTRGGIEFRTSDGNAAISNYISQASVVGIYLADADSGSVIGNMVSGGFRGIALLGSHGNIIMGNIASDCERGIFLEDSSWNEIRGNTVMNSTWGIWLEEFPGIVSTENNIIGNIVLNNTYGIYLQGVHSNRIHHNNIINNTIQAYDDWSSVPIGNHWDNGYVEPLDLTVSGGNYWSDYIGPDNLRGVAQSNPGSDGVGDIPYNITGGTSRDYYPLLTPVAPPPPLSPYIYDYAMPNKRDIFLSWDFPPSQGVSHFLIYRASNQTDFDFSAPWVNTSSDINPITKARNPLTTIWLDVNATNIGHPDYRKEQYYAIRTVNIKGLLSATSNTVGYYQMEFVAGPNAFSLPLKQPVPQSLDALMLDMGTETISWLDQNDDWQTYPANPITPMAEMGGGYVVEFPAPSSYVFTGEPASMVLYQDGFGFDDATRDDISATVNALGDVTVSWTPIPGANNYCVLRSESRNGFHNGSFTSQNILAPPFLDAGAASAAGELYYIVVPSELTDCDGSSTYSIGVITEEYSGNEMFGLPLKPTWGDKSADWYVENIPNALGMVYLDDGVWKAHFKEFPEGVYDTAITFGRGYEISVYSSSKYSFIGW
jgi:parallel beta-helix repeat protein